MVLKVNSTNIDEVFKLVKKSLDEGSHVELNLDNIPIMNSDFISSVLGKLSLDYTNDEIKKYIHFVGLDEDDEYFINQIMDNIEVFYTIYSAGFLNKTFIYLSNTEWIEQKPRHELFRFYVKGNHELEVPLNSQYRDIHLRIAEVIKNLAIIEERTEGEIVRQIKEI